MSLNCVRVWWRPAALVLALGVSTPRAAQAQGTAASKSLGEKSLMYLRMDFGDAPGEPVKRPDVDDSMNLVNQFFDKASGGKFKLNVTVINTLRMPRYRTYYRDKDVKEFLEDATLAASRTGLKPENYDFVVVATKVIGGRPRVEGVPNGREVAVNGDFYWRRTAQELLSNLGIVSTDLWQPKGAAVLGPGEVVPYGDPWDFQGGQITIPASSVLNGGAKFKLGWLSANEFATASQAKTYKIGSPKSATPLKSVRAQGEGGVDYWVHFRPLDDNPFSKDGVLVYRVKPDGSAPQLLSMNAKDIQLDGKMAPTPRPNPNPNPNQIPNLTPEPEAAPPPNPAPLMTGYTFTDGKVFITPLTATGSDIEVAVNIGPFPNNRKPTLDLGADKWEGNVGDELLMAGLGEDPDGDTLAYHWDFGDGTKANNVKKPKHAWKVGGLYTVKVFVTDGKGGTAEATGDFTIGGGGEPPADGAAPVAAPVVP